MVSTITVNIIEMILKRELKVADFNFEPYTWDDAFILKLLIWFERNVENNLYGCKFFYEQVVRILYHIVIYMNKQNFKLIDKLFNYFFSNDEIITPDFLMKVYKYLIKDLNNFIKDNTTERESIDVFIGIWNNEEMKDKIEHLIIKYTDVNDVGKCLVYYNDDENDFISNIKSMFYNFMM